MRIFRSEDALTLIRGNSLPIVAELSDSETGEVIVLSGTDKVLFVIKAADGIGLPGNESGEIYRKILTSADQDGEGKLRFTIEPADTLDKAPLTYRYGVTYMPGNGAEAYTFAEGDFILRRDTGNVADIESE